MSNNNDVSAYHGLAREVLNEVKAEFGDTFDVFLKYAPDHLTRLHYIFDYYGDLESYVVNLNLEVFNVIYISHKGLNSSQKIDSNGWRSGDGVYLKVVILHRPKPSAVIWYNLNKHPGYSPDSMECLFVGEADNEFVFDDAKKLCTSLKQPLMECVAEYGAKYEENLLNEKN